MTRAAARALGLDTNTYQWVESMMGLVRMDHAVAPPDVVATFAPLSRPADAFVLESDLRMNVTYQSNGRSLGIFVQSATRSGNMGYMTALPADADKTEAMKLRMLAVTQFAALTEAVAGV